MSAEKGGNVRRGIVPVSTGGGPAHSHACQMIGDSHRHSSLK